MSALSALQLFFISFLFILAHFCLEINLELRIKIHVYRLYWKGTLNFGHGQGRI